MSSQDQLGPTNYKSGTWETHTSHQYRKVNSRAIQAEHGGDNNEVHRFWYSGVNALLVPILLYETWDTHSAWDEFKHSRTSAWRSMLFTSLIIRTILTS